jgi:hypothetical protein
MAAFDQLQTSAKRLYAAPHDVSAVASRRPCFSKGAWCGGIPVNDGDVPAVIGGEGDVDETERQLAATELDSEVQAAWLPHVRVNFTLDG